MDDELAKLPYVIHPTGTSVPHFRAIIPVNLRPYADGRKVFKRTLGKDRLKQRERYAQFLAEYETLLANARASAAQEPLASTRPVGPVRLLKALNSDDQDQLNIFVESWQARTLEWHDEQVSHLAEQELEEYERGLTDRLAMLQLAVRRMSAPAEWEAEIAELLEEECGLRLLDECPDKRAFMMRVLGEEQAALKASLARFSGSWVPTPPLPKTITEPEEPIALAPLQKVRRKEGSAYLLKQCLVDWSDTSGKKEKTRKEFSAIFLRFAAFVGDNGQSVDSVRVDQINGRRHVIEWLESVAKEQRVERKTLAKYLAAVRAVLEIATNRAAIDANPAMGIKLETLALRGLPAGRAVVTKDSKRPLDASEIRRYFTRMDYWLDDHRVERAVSYWFPLLLFAFGARPEELATLMRDDVRVDEHGQYWLHVFHPALSPDGLPRLPKHNASIRHLPVPQRLMELGFADYVESIPHGEWLLPCKASAPLESSDSSEGRAQQTLNYLNPYLRQIVEVTDPKKTTYSLRHTFRDELRRVEVPREVQDALTGHAGTAPNAGSEIYGSIWYPQEPLLRAMRSLRHLELLPDGYPTWAEFRDSPPSGNKRQLVKK
ncbi:hypothetical protein [Burkholderia pseudomallei]|uniref:hypothetical protein n=1 Tax=Burkholderia pseudomallei TaxID=28450 RepID=UPI000F1B9EFC|nr:hypothetical protein [Burkholderia pseudomallei]VBG99117.1 phage integrase [Burkholderia pseudomallei]